MLIHFPILFLLVKVEGGEVEVTETPERIDLVRLPRRRRVGGSLERRLDRSRCVNEAGYSSRTDLDNAWHIRSTTHRYRRSGQRLPYMVRTQLRHVPGRCSRGRYREDRVLPKLQRVHRKLHRSTIPDRTVLRNRLSVVRLARDEQSIRRRRSHGSRTIVSAILTLFWRRWHNVLPRGKTALEGTWLSRRVGGGNGNSIIMSSLPKPTSSGTH